MQALRFIQMPNLVRHENISRLRLSIGKPAVVYAMEIEIVEVHSSSTVRAWSHVDDPGGEGGHAGGEKNRAKQLEQ